MLSKSRRSTVTCKRAKKNSNGCLRTLAWTLQLMKSHRRWLRRKSRHLYVQIATLCRLVYAQLRRLAQARHHRSCQGPRPRSLRRRGSSMTDKSRPLNRSSSPGWPREIETINRALELTDQSTVRPGTTRQPSKREAQEGSASSQPEAMETSEALALSRHRRIA